MLQITINRQAVLLISVLCIVTLYGSWIDRAERKLYGVKPGVSIQGYQVGGLLPGEVEVIMDELVIKFRKMPRDTYIDRNTGVIVPEELGAEVNVEATTRAIFNAEPNTRVEIIKTKVLPLHSARDLIPITREIGAFHTWFYGSWQRYENILLASRSINNQIIWPGDTLSFNEIVGPRTPERGYRPAPVIGGDGIGFGGGVCQVSTTLYNAALRAGLKVVERHQHSSRVPYVAPGKDATVVYGDQDLRLCNNLAGPVVIKSGIYRGKISVSILGK